MTDNPAKALIHIVEYFKENKNEIITLCNEDKIKFLYAKCESVLEKEKILKYDESVDCVFGIKDNLSQTLSPLQPNFDDIVQCIEFFCKHNYELRLKNHSVITEKLMEYKKQSINNSVVNDAESNIFQKIFFESFGFPMINKIDFNKMFNANTLKDLGFIK